jgi:hypothetical protein
MSIHHRAAILLLAASAISLSACDKGDQAKSGSATAGSAAPGTTAAATAQAATSLTPKEFLAKLPPTTCKWLGECKNDKVKFTLTTTAMMVAGFGSMDKPELAKQVKGVGDAMKKDKRSLPNTSECETIGGVAMQVIGLTPEALEAKIGKTVQYDGAKAAACIAAIQSPFALCATEVKLEGEPKLADLDAYGKEVEAPFDAHTKACSDVFTGTVEQGKACEYDFECKGENAGCKKKVCVSKTGH